MEFLNFDKYDIKMDMEDLNIKLQGFLEDDTSYLHDSSSADELPSFDVACKNEIDIIEENWLENFMSEHPVLNDRMISDALQTNPLVNTEHSYSLSKNETPVDMTINKASDCDARKIIHQKNISTENGPGNHTLNTEKEICLQKDSANKPLLLNGKVKFLPVSTAEEVTVKKEVSNIHPSASKIPKSTRVVTLSRTVNPHTLLKPTYILPSQNNSSEHNQISILTKAPQSTTEVEKVLPKMELHVEAVFSENLCLDKSDMPPTPPSSNNSDSDGCQSPGCSQPSSPYRNRSNILSSYTQIRKTPSPTCSAPFFMNPIPTSGILILSEEEKRTLVSEGYPIPCKLPLTKSEEKNLKKIRRKIKNKISAQESRRKKKDYLDSLERKVESFSQENVELKKKMDSLENTNRSLACQLQKLQAIVNKLRPQNASQTGTCLMVLVLCFAIFWGTWSPLTLSMGYSGMDYFNTCPETKLEKKCPSNQNLEQLSAQLVQNLGTRVKAEGNTDSSFILCKENAENNEDSRLNILPPSDPYGEVKLKSRVLLSIKEEEDPSFLKVFQLQTNDGCAQWALDENVGKMSTTYPGYLSKDEMADRINISAGGSENHIPDYSVILESEPKIELVSSIKSNTE